MEIGAGLDARLGLGLDELRELAREAARLGYTSLWTPNAAYDPFLLCAEWWRAAGIATGISVLPIPLAGSPAVLARAAATLAALTEGRFVLGIGSGAMRRGALATMREHLTAIGALLDGSALGIRAPRAAVHLGALGPRMLRLAGELADGVDLNWCTPEHVAWSRERVAEGARRAGRDPRSVPLVEYVRVCVDEDVERARLAMARALLPYALRPPPSPRGAGYRGHFARMGLGDAIEELEARRDRGASTEELARAFSAEALGRVSAWGPADAVREGFRRLAAGLDVALVRVVTARPGTLGVRSALEACRP